MAPAGRAYARRWRPGPLDRIRDAEDGHFRLWAGFKSTADEYKSLRCLLCTANVESGFSGIIRGRDGMVGGGPKLTADRTIFEIRMRL